MFPRSHSALPSRTNSSLAPGQALFAGQPSIAPPDALGGQRVQSLRIARGDRFFFDDEELSGEEEEEEERRNDDGNARKQERRRSIVSDRSGRSPPASPASERRPPPRAPSPRDSGSSRNFLASPLVAPPPLSSPRVPPSSPGPARLRVCGFGWGVALAVVGCVLLAEAGWGVGGAAGVGGAVGLVGGVCALCLGVGLVGERVRGRVASALVAACCCGCSAALIVLLSLMLDDQHIEDSFSSLAYAATLTMGLHCALPFSWQVLTTLLQVAGFVVVSLWSSLASPSPANAAMLGVCGASVLWVSHLLNAMSPVFVDNQEIESREGSGRMATSNFGSFSLFPNDSHPSPPSPSKPPPVPPLSVQRASHLLREVVDGAALDAAARAKAERSLEFLASHHAPARGPVHLAPRSPNDHFANGNGPAPRRLRSDAGRYRIDDGRNKARAQNDGGSLSARSASVGSGAGASPDPRDLPRLSHATHIEMSPPSSARSSVFGDGAEGRRDSAVESAQGNKERGQGKAEAGADDEPPALSWENRRPSIVVEPASPRRDNADNSDKAKGASEPEAAEGHGEGRRFPEDELSAEQMAQINSLLVDIDNWDFPIFELTKASNNHALYFVALSVFKRRNFLDTFQIPEAMFKNFLVDVEEAYHDNPYHNRSHAADGFDFTAFCSCIAAIVHDVDHNGFNNDFLIRTAHPRAITYNDRACQENHHLSTAFQIMAREGRDVLGCLGGERRGEARRLVIELVLATDMGVHAEVLAQFKEMLDSGGVSLDDEEDLLMVTKMALKCADISHTCKRDLLHADWTQRITAEFHSQGDKERELGLVVSGFMDRHQNNLAKSQLGFFRFVVVPLFEAWIRWLDQEPPPPYLDLIRSHQRKYEHMQALEAQGLSVDFAKLKLPAD